MVQKKKLSKSTSVKRKSPSASESKRKLGEASLDWITDTAEGEEVLSEQAESSKNESAGKSKKKKIGVLKKYVSEEAEKKMGETLEVIPAISDSSSTIIKGKRVTPAKVEETQKTEVIEEDKKKTISVEDTSVKIGKTYKITKEKELVIAEEEYKTISGKKDDVSDDKKILPEYEVKKEDVTTEEEISEKPSVYFPEDSSTIVKKRGETESQEEIISSEDKTPSEKNKTVPSAAKKEVPPSAKKKWVKISGTYESLKKERQKVSRSILKTFKFDKTKLRKSVSSVINVYKLPVKTVSAIDRKITQSTGVSISDFRNVEKSILKNIKSTDTEITKSAKKLLDSILD